MVISKSETKKLSNGKNWLVHAYNNPSFESMGIAYSEINGRYPQQGWCINKQCDEAYLINSGKGIICIEDKTYTFKKGDVVYIPANAKFYCIGKKVKFWCPTSPKFFDEQHFYID